MLKTQTKRFLALLTAVFLLFTSYQTILAEEKVEYFSVENAVALDVVGISKSETAKLVKLWVGEEGGAEFVYLAVKSSYRLKSATINGYQTLEQEMYDRKQPIYIDGVMYETEGLKFMNTFSRFTVFRFPLAEVEDVEGFNLGIEVEGTFYWHDIPYGEATNGQVVKLPDVSANVTKHWVGGPKNPVEVQLYKEYRDKVVAHGEPIELSTEDNTYVWDALPQTNAFGFLYLYYIDEVDPGLGYSQIVEGEYNIEDRVYTWILTNTYFAEGKYVIEAAKVLRDKDLVAGQFEFELVDEEGNVIATAKNDADGKVVFEALEFTDADVGIDFVFVVREKVGADANVVYDETEFALMLEVVDNGDGTLTISVVEGEEEIVFVNKWKEDAEEEPVDPKPEEKPEPTEPTEKPEEKPEEKPKLPPTGINTNYQLYVGATLISLLYITRFRKLRAK